MRFPFWRPRSLYGWGTGLAAFGILVLPVALLSRDQTLYDISESAYQAMGIWIFGSAVSASWIGTRLEARRYGSRREKDRAILESFRRSHPEPGRAVLELLEALSRLTPPELRNIQLRLADGPTIDIGPLAAAATRSGRMAEAEAAIRLAHIVTGGASSGVSLAAGHAAAAFVVSDLVPALQIRAFVQAFEPKS